MTEKIWSVEIVLDEHQSEESGCQVTATARLRASGQPPLEATGRARRSSWHTSTLECSDELAVARALAELSHGLFCTAATSEAATRRAFTSAARVGPRPAPGPRSGSTGRDRDD